MLKIKVSSLKPGMKLAKDLFTYDSQLLLAAGTSISQEKLDYFHKRGIEEVFIAEEIKPTQVSQPFAEVYGTSLSSVRSIFKETKIGRPLDNREVAMTIKGLSQQVSEEVNVYRDIRLLQNKSDYLFTHSVNVAVLAMMVGRWMKLEEDKVQDLGTGGLLHDIGKAFIDENLLNKPDKLTDDEYEEMKQHSALGFRYLVHNSSIKPEIIQAVLYHHERADGSGYPMGVKDYGNNPYAAIIAVCDTFDAITSNRVYSKKSSPFTAADMVWEQSFGKLNPAISKFFYGKITPFFTGSRVRLSNNQSGTVVFVDPIQPTRPIVRIGDDYINLATDRSLHVAEVIDG